VTKNGTAIAALVPLEQLHRRGGFLLLFGFVLQLVAGVATLPAMHGPDPMIAALDARTSTERPAPALGVPVTARRE
jgi:hypothetical protein